MCRVASRELGGSIAMVAEARAFVAATLRRWDLEALVVDAELLTSELVTNAVLHARSDVTVSVAVADGTAEIGVTDASPEPPTPAVGRLGRGGRSGTPARRPGGCGLGGGLPRDRQAGVVPARCRDGLGVRLVLSLLR